MDMDENEYEKRPRLDLEDDEPELDHHIFPINPKKQLNLELSATDLTPAADLMKVYLRIRPFFNEEIEIGEDQNCFHVESDSALVAQAPKDSSTYKNAQHQVGKGITQKFTFSKIFSDNVGQKQFFEEAVLGTVKGFMQGQNCLVFTYGVTNSGKTYTMQGVQKDVGILPRSLDVIFNSIKDCQWDGCMLKPHMFCDVLRLPSEQEEEERKLKNALLKLADLEETDIGMTTIDSTMSEDSLMRHSILNSTSGDTNCDATEIGEVLSSGGTVLEDTAIDMDSLNNVRFSVWVSFAEIYNENVHDLFAPMVKRKTPKGRPILLLREDKNGTPYIRGLREIHVTSAEEAYKLLTVGKKNLQIACTKLNRNSSRSHCIFTIKMLRVVDDKSPSRVKMSMLSFCDLAGSERYTKTQSLGDRIKEAGNINTSLLTLGRCIKILRHNQINKEHPQVVPFRESKLTRLFQSFFCGKGQASMIVNINSCASTFDETVHVLSYSAIAKQILVAHEPEKAKKKHKSQKFSMLLGQHCRDTIGWASPGTCAKVFKEEKIEKESEDESEDEETASETERERDLMELVRLLKEQLVEEKQKQLMIEARVREEVCKEVSEQVNKIESYYSERLKQERANLEEKAEKRLDIYMKSLNRSRKRQRLLDDAEIEEAEQTKVQQYEKKIEDLRDQLAVLTKQNEQLKAAATTASKQRDQLQQENTSIKFHMSDLEIKLEKSETSKLDLSVANSSACEPSDLASKLSESERELEKQRQMVTKLQQVIDMLQCNAADGESKVQEAKKEVDQKTKQVASLEEELHEKNTKIEELQNELVEKKSKLMEMSSLLLQQEKQLEDLQKALDQITDELESLQQENSSQDNMLITMHQELEELRRKENKPCDQHNSNKYKDASTEVEKDRISINDSTVTELTKEKACLLSQVAELRGAADKYKEEAEILRKQKLQEIENLTQQHEVELEELKLELSSQSKLKEQLVDVKHDLELLRKDKKELEIELQGAIDLQKEYEAIDEAKEKELDSAYAMNDQLKEELKQSQQAMETLKTELLKLKTMDTEMVAEHVQQDEMMNNMQLEMQEKSARIVQLEAELQHLKMLTSGQHRDSTAIETALEEEKQKVTNLMQKLNDAEYKHQILCRQLRREKINVEKMLKVAEEERDGGEKQITQLQLELNEMKQKFEESAKEHENDLDRYKARALKLEAVIEDLEMCLKSSKEHEAKSLCELENIRKKCKLLENDCNNKEDTICSLNDELERIREESMMVANLSNAESTAQMESLRNEVMENKKVIDHLELEIHQLKEERDMYKQKVEVNLETTECNIKELEMAKAELETELKSCMVKIKKLSCNLESVAQELTEAKNNLAESEDKTNDIQNRLIKKESECEQLKNDLGKTLADLSEMKLQYDIIKEQLEEAKSEMCQKLKDSNEEVQDIRNKLDTKEADLATAKDTIAGLEQRLVHVQSDSSSELKDLQSQLIGRCNELAECRDRIEILEAQVKEFNKIKEELNIKADLLTSKLNEKQFTSTEEVKRLEDKLKITIDELVESRDHVNKHVKMYSELEEKCIQLEEDVKELKEKNKSLQECIAEKTESESAREDAIKGLEKNYQDLETLYQTELSQAKTRISELETDLEKKEKHILELKETIQDLTGKLHEQTLQVEECTLLKSQIVILENKLVSLESAVSDAVSIKSKFEDLESELEKHQLLKEKAERTIRSLQEEVDELETRLKQSSSLSKDRFKLQEEVKMLHDELSQKETAARKERRMLEETIEKLEQENKGLNSDSDELLAKVANLEQLEEKHKDELRGLQKNVEDTEKQLNNAVVRVKALEDELENCKQKLEMKEGKLKTRTDALSGFMSMMDREKEQCEAALADAKANERVIEQLKKTLELQEAAMQDQDTCLKNKEDEIIKLGEELQEHAERCLELQKKEQDYQREIKLLKEEIKVMKNKIKDMETSVSEQLINEELEMLRRANRRAEEKLAKAKAKQEEAEKQLRERVRYEADLKETNEELQKIERLLKERDEEIKLIRKQYEELKKQQSENNRNIQQEKETDSSALKILKTKFQAKEELVRQLEQEKLQWKERAEMIKEQKEQELIKWRSERDKLVVQIEKIIKEKEQQLAALQNNRDDSKIVELQQKIEEKEQIIKELRSRKERSGDRSRKQRHRNAESSTTDDDIEHLKNELCHLQRQLDQEQKIIKAKDCVIEDMRQQNYKLASQLSDEEAAKKCGVTSLDPTGKIEQSPIPRTRVKHGTKQKSIEYEQVTNNQNVTSAERAEPVPRIHAKRGRNKKVKSAQIDQDEDVSAGKRGNKRERKANRSVKHHNRSLHLDENNDPSLVIMSEDDVIDLDEPASKKSGLSVLINSTNITDLGKSILSTPKCMDSSLPDQTGIRLKKRLRNTVDKPLEISPEPEIEQSDAKAVHDIVRRKLRSRKK